MNNRKLSKIRKPGTVFLIKGTNVLFMSLGMKSKNQIDSFNGFDITTGQPVKRCDGQAVPAPKWMQARYWKALKVYAGSDVDMSKHG